MSLCGILPIDKPAGITSAGVVAKVRFLLSEGELLRDIKIGDSPKNHKVKAGHSGTLDPMASGILPIFLGEATAFIPYLPQQKKYTAQITFGVQTNTDDAEGETIAEQLPPKDIAAAVQEMLPKYCGLIQQTAPTFSALKYKGKPLYDYARKGIPTPPKIREVQVDNLELLEVQDNIAKVLITCGSGFYVRSLARCLGEDLNCGAHLSALQRTLAAGYDSAMPLAELEKKPPPERRYFIKATESALQHFASYTLSSAQAAQLSISKKADDDEGDIVRLFVGNRFGGLACRKDGVFYNKKMLSWTRNPPEDDYRTLN